MNKIQRFFTALMAFVLLLGNVAIPVRAAQPWNVTGIYEVTFLLDGDLSMTPYTHHATLTQSGASVTGDGGYPATGGDTYHWNVTSGSQTGDSLNLTAVYDLGAVGTTMHMVGNIAVNGTVSGTWDDNFGGARTGTWTMTKGVSVPRIHTPTNGAIVTQAALVKVDWTDSVGANPPFEYQYEAYSDVAYSTLVYSSSWLAASEIPTVGTPPGEYYLRVRARNASLIESAWSNGVSNPYHVTVVLNAVPVPAECNQAIAYNLIEGTNGNDTLSGTNGSDLILAKDGSDAVNGKGGDDCIVGGNGNDSLAGGDGNDAILGEGGNDSISGGAGNDALWGGAGSDAISGGAGVDSVNGGAGTDACSAETLTQCNP